MRKPSVRAEGAFCSRRVVWHWAQEGFGEARTMPRSGKCRIIRDDPATMRYRCKLFVEHGSTEECRGGALRMLLDHDGSCDPEGAPPSAGSCASDAVAASGRGGREPSGSRCDTGRNSALTYHLLGIAASATAAACRRPSFPALEQAVRLALHDSRGNAWQELARIGVR